MKTKIVYSVVSDYSDIYLEQTIVSIYSLRVHNPNAKVILVVDEQTNDTISGKRAKILEYVSEKIVIKNLNNLTKRQRSRFIKTSLRKYIIGDYLFIDSDTIVTSSLNDIDLLDLPIAAVKDRHFFLYNHRCKKDIYKYAKIIDWQIGDNDHVYFNSGVFYAKDVFVVHEFYQTWHDFWKDGCKKGIDYDQPSLGKTNALFDNIVGELDGVWNCQVLTNGLPFLYNAKILHYFNSNLKYNKCYSFALSDKDIYMNIKLLGDLSNDVKQRIVNAKSEFRVDSEIIGGSMVDFQYTFTYILFRGIYLKSEKIFALLDWMNKQLVVFFFLLKRIKFYLCYIF